METRLELADGTTLVVQSVVPLGEIQETYLRTCNRADIESALRLGDVFAEAIRAYSERIDVIVTEAVK